MPATYVHHAFSEDVFKVLNNDTQDRLGDSKDLFNLFGKSFDVFYFIKPKYGYYAHGNNSNLYFKNIVKFIKNNSLENDTNLLAYLYGSICHYVLDTTIHPFVYYKSGQYKWNKETLKYRSKHAYTETMMDVALYLKRNNKPIYKARLVKNVGSKVKFTEELMRAIDEVFDDTFDFKGKTAKIYYRGYKNYRLALKFFMTSRFGIKKVFYKIGDLFKVYKKSNLSDFCYYVKNIDERVLNLEHKEWCYPVDKNLMFHYSFYDLYDIAIEKARVMINQIDAALVSNEKDLKTAVENIGDLSYFTGVDTSKKLKMKYFEF